MTLITFRNLTGALSVIAMVGTALVILARVARRSSSAARALLAAVGEWRVWLAWVVALACTMLSLYLSEHLGIPPCRLCWFQRVAMYPLTIVLLVGAMRRDRNVVWYAAPLAAVGLVTSVYHRLIELNPTWESTTCSATGPSCATPPYTALGFMTPPVMAGIGFAAILALLLLTTPGSSQPEEATS